MSSISVVLFAITIGSLLAMVGYHNQLRDRARLKPKLVPARSLCPPEGRRS